MGLAAAAVATGLALVLHPEPALGAVSVYLLGVVGASAIGGALGGVVASAGCFLSLTYFFTEPRHTLRVANEEDIVALATFLVVALVVGTLVSRLLSERQRAARNEREARLLGYVAVRANSGESLDGVMADLARMLADEVGLDRCEIVGSIGGHDFTVAHGSSAGGRPTHAIPLRTADRELGALTVVASPRGLDAADRLLLESVGRQLVVSLERAELDAQVSDARLEAQTNEARAALFSSVTHDLKTPLSSIKAGVTSLMQPGADLDDDRRRELLTTVLEETDRLNRLLENLLELAKVRAGALSPAKERTAIEDVVDAVLHRMRSALARVRVRTIIRDVPDVFADPVQIDQVLTNLLDNAVHHSPPDGEVTVSVAPWQRSVQVRIVDEGPGIPRDKRERVFDAFYQEDVDARSGSGLGLAIARAIVLAHDGRIWVEGAPSGGAAIVFELPVAERASGAAEPGE